MRSHFTRVNVRAVGMLHAASAVRSESSKQ